DRHIPGTESEHEVTGSHAFGDERDRLGEGLFESDVIVRDAIGDQRPGDSGHGVLAGGEDVEDDDLIGQPQGLAELLPELHGPRVQVGLEDGPYASAVGDDPAGGGQHGTQLGGVMGVVVDDAHTAGDAAFLEAAA